MEITAIAHEAWELTEYAIFWSDLTAEAQQVLIDEGFEVDENVNLAPLAIISQQKAEMDRREKGE